MTVQQLLPYLAPPILGALIGYVTNYIAIRMLFRPLRPWRVLGVRVPLTPGIIPGKRHELAEKIGEMVGTHLLTSEDVGRALAADGFRRELKGAVNDKLAGFLDRDLGPAAELVPAVYRGRFRDLVEVLRWKTVRAVFDYLQSTPFERAFRGYLARQGEELLGRSLEQVLDPRHYAMLHDHLEDRVVALLQAESTARAVEKLVDDRLERLLSSERPIRELLPGDFWDLLLARLEQEVPPLLERFGGLLYDPSFRERLVRKAKEAIEGFLDSLEGFSGLLSGFLDLNRIYARLPEFLDKAGDEISRWLREEKTQAQVAALLRERLSALLDRPAGAYLEKVPYEKVAEGRRFIRQRAVAVVRSRRTAETLISLAEKGVDRIKDRSFASLLEQALPEGGIETGRELLAEKLLALIRSPQARQALDRVLAEQAERWLFENRLGKLSARLPADVREELEEGLYQQLAELLKKEVPPLVETLNVRRMVEQKVNTLDILQVEGLLLGIMQEQFKYINLFGALLGFLIGLVNLLVLSAVPV